MLAVDTGINMYKGSSLATGKGGNVYRNLQCCTNRLIPLQIANLQLCGNKKICLKVKQHCLRARICLYGFYLFCLFVNMFPYVPD